MTAKALFCLIGMCIPNAQAQKVEVVEVKSVQESRPLPGADDESGIPETTRGRREKARTYFQRNPDSSEVASGDRYLGLHLGSFLSSDGYKWGGRDKISNPGNLSMGVSYRLGEWMDSMDLTIRGDFQTYSVDGEQPLKMSLLPMVSFPDVNSGFPLYFGAGVGGGVFFKQLSSESSISLDYQLVAGARFLEVYRGLGFLVEFGLKNHLHLLSDGQFNGLFLSLGTAFRF